MNCDDLRTYLHAWWLGASKVFHWSDQVNSLAVAKFSQKLQNGHVALEGCSLDGMVQSQVE